MHVWACISTETVAVEQVEQNIHTYKIITSRYFLLWSKYGMRDIFNINQGFPLSILASAAAPQDGDTKLFILGKFVCCSCLVKTVWTDGPHGNDSVLPPNCCHCICCVASRLFMALLVCLHQRPTCRQKDHWVIYSGWFCAWVALTLVRATWTWPDLNSSSVRCYFKATSHFSLFSLSPHVWK